MKRLAAGLALGAVTVIGFLEGIGTHVYAVRLGSFGHAATLPVVGGGGSSLTFRTFGPALFAGIAGLALLGGYVACCVTLAIMDRPSHIALTGRRTERRADRPLLRSGP